MGWACATAGCLSREVWEMPSIKTCVLVAAYLTCCSFHPPARADDTQPAKNFDGDLNEVQMLDEKNGWAVGRTSHAVYLLRTEDGGKSWADISPRPIQTKKPLVWPIADVALTFRLVDATHGWAGCIRSMEGPGDNMDLFSTDDGGKHWQANAFKSSVGTIISIQFVDKEHGFIQVVSDTVETGHDRKAIYRTVNGGRTWQTASDGEAKHPTEGALPYLGFSAPMVFRDDEDGWVGGTAEGDQQGFFFHTTDSGKTWQSQNFPLPQGTEFDHGDYDTPIFSGTQKMDGVMEVRFENRGSLQRAVVFYGTHDGGGHWEKTGTSPVEQSKPRYTSIAFADADHGWLLAGNEIFATTDRGATWTKINSSLPRGTSSGPGVIQFLDLTHGWVLVDDLEGPDDKGHLFAKSELLQTTDGGHTWTYCFGTKLDGTAPHGQ